MNNDLTRDQWKDIKRRFTGTILLFRIGDDYEAYQDDALKAEFILDTPATKRDKIHVTTIPAGQLDTATAALIRAGYRVAHCSRVQ